MVKLNIKPYSILFAGIGFYTLGAQTLIFRASFRVFDGSEFCTGLFFFSWLLWTALGAALFRLIPVNENARLKPVHLAIFYPAACLLQIILLVNSRRIWSIPEYELFSIKYLLLTLPLFNAPVSLLSGYLFAMTSKLENPGKLYRVEAIGAFAGAVITTILLAAGLYDGTVFAVTGLIFMIMLYRTLPPQIRARVSIVIYLIGISCVGGYRIHEDYANALRNFLPDMKGLEKTFMTSQAAYAYGKRDNDFIVSRWNTICTSLPGRTAPIAALGLAQNPKAENILLTGDPEMAALALEFCKLPGIKIVYWLCTDPQFPGKLFEVTPEKYRDNVKLICPKRTVRSFLNSENIYFDMAIIQPPVLTSLAANQFYSKEFFQLVKSRLKPDGVMGISFASSENFLSPEQKYFGAVLLTTLKPVFNQIVLVPGEASWFFAGREKAEMTKNPEIMEQRLKKIKGLANLFPPDAIYSIYESFRVQMVMQTYNKYIKENEVKMIANTDYSPRLFLEAATNYLRRLGQVIPPDLSDKLNKGIFYAGFLLFPLLLLVEHLIRLLLCRDTTNRHSGAAMLTVFLTSVSAMIWCIAAMFIFQMRFGSLFLWFGMLNASFMLGIFGGGTLADKLRSDDWLSFPVTGVAFCLITALLLPFTAFAHGPAMFLPLFALVGFSAGVFLPLGGKLLGEKRGGALLEALDCSGGAIGAVLAGLLLLPLLGPFSALLVSLSLVLVWSLTQFNVSSKPFYSGLYRTAAFCLGLAVWLLLTGSANGAELKLSDRQEKFFKLDGVRTQQMKVDGKPYIQVQDKDGKITGWVFKSTDFLKKSPEGYTGPIEMIISLDSKGKVTNFSVTKYTDTKSFMKKAIRVRQELIGVDVSPGATEPEIDAVTGATYSSEAMIKTVLQAGRSFAKLLKLPEVRKTEKKERVTSHQPMPGDISDAPPPASLKKIDPDKYKILIRKGQLSDRKAMYQTPLQGQ